MVCNNLLFDSVTSHDKKCCILLIQCTLKKLCNANKPQQVDHYHTLTTVCLDNSTISRSSLTPDPVKPPNSAAFFLSTGVRVKSLHGGGGCPVTLGELHSPAGGIIYDIISNYY